MGPYTLNRWLGSLAAIVHSMENACMRTVLLLHMDLIKDVVYQEGTMHLIARRA